VERERVGELAIVSAAELVSQAIEVRERAYAPYSEYQVGSAVLASDGTVSTGCNVENASYPACICAERVALTSAVAAGHRDFVAIAVVTRDGGTPCGICRQVMAEIGADMTVYIASADGSYRTTSVQALLPDAFNADSL
jgi:cytidine deaminase